MLRQLVFGLAVVLLTITVLYSLSPGETRKLLREFVGFDTQQVTTATNAATTAQSKRHGAGRNTISGHSTAAEPKPVGFVIINRSTSQQRSGDVSN